MGGGLKTENGKFLLHFQNFKSSNRCRSVYGTDIIRHLRKVEVQNYRTICEHFPLFTHGIVKAQSECLSPVLLNGVCQQLLAWLLPLRIRGVHNTYIVINLGFGLMVL